MGVRRSAGGRSIVAALLVALGACGTEQTALDDSVPIPRDFEVTAVGVSAVRLSWERVSGTNVSGYEVQRRENLQGDFKPLATNVPQSAGRITFFDNDVDPDTWYGYRVVALTSLGGRSGTSTVGGTRTPPPPTLVLTAATAAPNDASADPDGYSASILGPRDTITAAVATNGERRFANLRAGTYTVVLRGLAGNCDFASGDSIKVVQVTDVGVTTESRLRYDVSCRDPQKGSIVVRYEQEGDTTDANGVRVSITGLLTEIDPVDTARVYARTQLIAGRIAVNRYDNLRRGNYEVTLDDLASICTLQGARKRSLTVRALSIDTVRFQTACTRPVVIDTAGKPLVIANTWSASAAGIGAKVALEIGLDTRAVPNTRFAGAQAELTYDRTVLRYDSSRAIDFPVMSVNGRTQGIVIYGALDTDNVGVTGQVRVGRLWFTVIGATGMSTTTRTTVRSVPTLGATAEYASQTRVTEATFTVGQFSGGQNQPPVARANGPYAATAGVATQLSGIGSSDPDGQVASYRWDFGDGTAAAGETVQHTYTNAGTYTATLTVTDDKGLTATDPARVTVTTSGAPNQSPVARISAPPAATPSSSVTFSGTQSSDADGTIVSYAWAFGDGATGTGATTTHVYSATGTYNVVLTVTDNRGATSTAQHVITVTASNPGTTPFTWSATFGTVDAVTKFVDLTVTLDLTANIAETPGVEELGTYIVDSLKWDPVVLKLEAFNFGPGQQQAIDQSDIARGKVRFSGSTLAGQGSGVLTIARLRFRVTGGAGARTTTQTIVGPLIGTPTTGSFNYRPKVEVREGTLVVP